jgi:hypothetical protein
MSHKNTVKWDAAMPHPFKSSLENGLRFGLFPAAADLRVALMAPAGPQAEARGRRSPREA